MSTFLKLVEWLKAPYKKKMEGLKSRYKDLNDLSQVAVEIGDEAAYHSLQSEMKEVFFEIFSLSIVEGIYWLLPHVLLMAALSIRFNVITLFGREIGIYIWYPVLAILVYLIRKRSSIKRAVAFLLRRIYGRNPEDLVTGVR